MPTSSRASRFARARYRPYHLLLAFAALVLLATLVFALRATASLRENIAFVTQTQQVMRETTALLAVLGDAEFFHRRYLVTGDLAQLPRYRDATARLVGQLERLRELTGADGAQVERLARVDEYVRDYDRASDRSIVFYQTQGLEAAREHQARGEAAAAGMAIRTAVRAMLDAEDAALRARQDNMAAVLQQAGVTLLVAHLLALAAALAAFWLIRRAVLAQQRQLELQFEAEHAQRVSREKSAFLASMSHEFRTPMNAIFGFTQLLAGSVRDPREQGYIRAIVASGKSLLSLINDILDLSKIEAGRLELAPEPTDLPELVESTLAVFSQMAAEKGLTLRAALHPALPEAMRLDPARLRQVLINLIGNAVKYTEEGGITVRAWCEPPSGDSLSLWLTVEDTGVGIPPDMHQRVFEPFVQSTGGDGVQREGTGLGLSITRRLVELMGGTLALESTVGRGTTFTVRLPDVEPTARPRRSGRDDWNDVDFARLSVGTVLVVDDVAWNRELIGAFFAGSAHRLLFAADGAEAVEMARRHRPDVVLMDIRMPRMDGREARDRIRALGLKTAVIAVTASSLGGEEAALREAFDAYVRKPFSKRELYSAVSEFLPPLAEAPGASLLEDEEPEELGGEDTMVEAGERIRLQQRLATVVAKDWPRLRATLPMRETGALARELGSIGRTLGHRPLESYGRRLRLACENFDVGAVESLLQQLPAYLPPGTTE